MANKKSWISSITIAACVLIASSQVHAGTRSVEAAVGWIQVGQDGGFSFSLVGDPALCTTGYNTNARTTVSIGTHGGVTMTADGAKDLYSTVLAAKLSGRTLKVYSNDNTTNTGWGCWAYAIDFGSP